MGVLALARALADAAPADVAHEWDARWHLGPIVERDEAERAAASEWMGEHASDLDWLYGRLADRASRDLLVRLLAHRLVGSRRIALGAGRESSERLTEFSELALACAAPDGLAGLPCYDLEPIGLDLRVLSVPMFAIHTFLLEQYRHPDIPAANVRPGDVVVDGGAFWGDTALWLSEQCAPDGRVVAFEADRANGGVLDANLRLNPAAATRIEIRFEALWNCTTTLALDQQGAATTVGPGGDGVAAVSLDGLQAEGVLDAVDFVKLDIEGAELQALEGAAGLIRERPPRMAVAVYHRPEDIFTLPRLLDALAPRYQFALTHRSLHQFDTVLFAWVDGT